MKGLAMLWKVASTMHIVTDALCSIVLPPMDIVACVMI